MNKLLLYTPPININSSVENTLLYNVTKINISNQLDEIDISGYDIVIFNIDRYYMNRDYRYLITGAANIIIYDNCIIRNIYLSFAAKNIIDSCQYDDFLSIRLKGLCDSIVVKNINNRSIINPTPINILNYKQCIIKHCHSVILSIITTTNNKKYHYDRKLRVLDCVKVNIPNMAHNVKYFKSIYLR